MRLSDLLEQNEMSLMGRAAEAIEVRGLTADSRRVDDGWLFAALPGSRADGRNFIDEAVARGAVAVLAPSGTRLADYPRPVALICDDNPRRRLARMAATFYGRQPRCIAAVTGTNGKTSTVNFARQLWDALGYVGASLGTLGLQPAKVTAPAALTTPDPVELMACLADLAREGCSHLAIEASSHGLEQYRLDGIDLAAAAFTNLSRDHLDYHGTMSAYFSAKRRLFRELLPKNATAVLNADAPEFESLAGDCAARRVRVIDYGRNARDLRLTSLEPGAGRLNLAVEVFGRKAELGLPLAGTFQAMNVLAALGLVLSDSEVEPERAIAATAGLCGVPGRVEPVGQTPSGGQVYVDYAHTPDALETVLQAVRPHTAGRLLVVFGCGGDRDAGKRPLMGEVADRLADDVIVTDDNPRSEDPERIRAAILAAVPRAQEIGDRRQAIFAAVAALGANDTLVIAGKGHEAGQILKDRILPFDDRSVAREALAALLSGGEGA